MSQADRGPHILAFALVAAVVGLILAYNIAKADELATPFHPALGFSVAGPDGNDLPIYFGVVKSGFATKAECMGEKGANDPGFHKFVEQMGTEVSKKLGGVEVKATTGCVDITKLPSKATPPAAPAAPVYDGRPKVENL
jgi:hypothetical protein